MKKLVFMIVFIFIGITCFADSLLNEIENGNTQKAKLLIKKNVGLSESDETGFNVLMSAALKGNFEIVKLLVAKGVGVNSVTKANVTPLMFACINDNYNIAKFLVEKGADVNARNKLNNTNTPLKYAIKSGNKKIITLLKSHGAFE